MPNGHRLVPPQCVRLVHKGAVGQRAREGSRDGHHVSSKQPEVPPLGLRQVGRYHPHPPLFKRPPFFLCFLWFGGLEQMGNGVVHAAVLPAEEGTQAQLHH